MTLETIATRMEGGVAWLTLNRPHVRNGIDQQMGEELGEAVRRATDDDAVRAIALTGAGPVFCAGGDLGGGNTDAAARTPEEQRQAGRTFMETAIAPTIRAIHHCPKPVVAAVNGHAVGAGIGLALAADIVIAARSARFMCRFVPSVALIPDCGATWTIQRAIGRPRAMALAMLGDDLTAERAEQWGMIWRSVADDQLITEAGAIAAQLANGPGFALAALKLAMRDAGEFDFDDALDRETDLSSRCTAHPDFCEAVTAFKTRRKPIFSGLSVDDRTALHGEDV